MKVYDVRVLPLHSDHVEIEWCVEDLEDPEEATVTISRSESPEGPWTVIGPQPVGNRNFFRDLTIDPTNMMRRLYYKVKIISGEGGSLSHESEPVTFLINPTRAALYQVKRLERYLRMSTGEPVYFFIKKTWGPRCVACNRHGAASSGCTVCYGTGIHGGYYDPIEGLLSKNPTQAMQTRIAGVEVNAEAKRMWTSNYPLLKAGDLIVDAMGIRWAVAPGINTSEHQGFPFRQIFVGTRLPSDHSTYHLPVPSLHSMVQRKESRGWKEERDVIHPEADFTHTGD
jgi:hypothetical protein